MAYQYRSPSRKFTEPPGDQPEGEKHKNDRANEIALIVVLMGLAAMLVMRAFMH
jgi:hypothetical protein